MLPESMPGRTLSIGRDKLSEMGKNMASSQMMGRHIQHMCVLNVLWVQYVIQHVCSGTWMCNDFIS